MDQLQTVTDYSLIIWTKYDTVTKDNKVSELLYDFVSI